ncbi:UNVERIFIED_CONTAM: hypothetical protein PYX00_001925 [Menopon gallinae]|uniref:Uncharacterized protein n=1 Tax=Menopon gallinae TaxID=328185 RepID=A0AAW2IF85_9NEOP
MPSFVKDSAIKKLKLSPRSDNSWDADDPSEGESTSISTNEEEKVSEVPDVPEVPETPETPETPAIETVHNANFFLEELSSDDEILTFQCPDNFDVKTLLNKTVGFKKPTKIKEENRKISCQIIENDKKTLTCIVPRRGKSAAFVKLPVVGHIYVTESFTPPKIEVDAEENTNTIPKIRHQTKRHPLLGTDWNEHLMMVKKQIKHQRKLLRKSLKLEKSLEKAEKKRKAEKRKLKDELSLLKKRQKLE